MKFEIEYADAPRRDIRNNKEETLMIYMDYLKLTNKLYNVNLKEQKTQQDFEEEREVIEVFMNDWLVINHKITRMDLIDACEVHKEDIYNNISIKRLKQSNSDIESARD